jgi:ATP-binding cassette subfamily F protein 3
LLRLVADQLWLVAGGDAAPFDGDLDDYAAWLRASVDAGTEVEKADAAPRGAAALKERKRVEAARRQQLSPLRATVTRAEADIARLSADIAELDRRLADPGLYEHAARAELAKMLEAQADHRRRLSAAEEAWLSASEALEAATRAD